MYRVCIVILYISFTLILMGSKMRANEMKEDENLYLAWGHELKDSFSLTFRLEKTSDNPIYVLCNRSIDSERGEVNNQPIEIVWGVSQCNGITSIPYKIRSGSLSRERFVLITETLEGIDDLFTVSLSKGMLAEEVFRRHKPTTDRIVLHLGIQVYEKFPNSDNSNGRLIFSEPLIIKYGQDQGVKLIAYENAGILMEVRAKEFGIKFPPLKY